jgi:hypothetical protein
MENWCPNVTPNDTIGKIAPTHYAVPIFDISLPAHAVTSVNIIRVSCDVSSPRLVGENANMTGLFREMAETQLTSS